MQLTDLNGGYHLCVLVMTCFLFFHEWVQWLSSSHMFTYLPAVDLHITCWYSWLACNPLPNLSETHSIPPFIFNEKGMNFRERSPSNWPIMVVLPLFTNQWEGNSQLYSMLVMWILFCDCVTLSLHWRQWYKSITSSSPSDIEHYIKPQCLVEWLMKSDNWENNTASGLPCDLTMVYCCGRSTVVHICDNL